MAKFTLLETVVYHRMLWAELAEKGCRKYEADFWEQHKIEYTDLLCSCFPCEFSSGDGEHHCSKCIFSLDCEEPESIYRNWEGSPTVISRKKYARLIRDITLKPKYAKELGE